jgi:hypothetical protein
MNVRDPRRTPSQAFGRTSWDVVVVVDLKRFVMSRRTSVSFACDTGVWCRGDMRLTESDTEHDSDLVVPAK